MNNRLQVGGLALIIKADRNDLNVGKTVELVRYFGSSEGGVSEWLVSCKERLHIRPDNYRHEALVESDRLLPLGDKQTQDELAKEVENENA